MKTFTLFPSVKDSITCGFVCDFYPRRWRALPFVYAAGIDVLMRSLRQMLDLELTLRINMDPYDIFTEGVFNYV